VFGVLFWFVLLPGPSGAILYRLAVYLRERWGKLGAFGRTAEQVYSVLEWPAARLTAAAFAVVGDFEDAVYCWRTQARAWADPYMGVVLAAGAGAMGVRLGMPLPSRAASSRGPSWESERRPTCRSSIRRWACCGARSCCGCSCCSS
jgi:adenosylcobinamide-phosphate synthase